MSNDGCIGEEGLQTILEQIEAGEVRPQLPQPYDGDRVQLFRLDWAEMLRQLFVPRPDIDERQEGDNLRFRQIFVRQGGVWRQARISHNAPQPIERIVTELETLLGETAEAMLMLEGYPAPSQDDSLGCRSHDHSPVYNLTYASRPPAHPLR